jgi:hypothetical protein
MSDDLSSDLGLGDDIEPGADAIEGVKGGAVFPSSPASANLALNKVPQAAPGAPTQPLIPGKLS